MTIAERLRLGFAVGLAVALVVGAAGLGALSLVTRQVGTLVNQEGPLREQHDAMLQALTDAEAGQRGYLIGGQPVSRARFEDAVAAFQVAAEGAARATESEPVHALLIAEVAAAEDWMDTFAVPVVERYATDPEGALTWARTGEGRELFAAYAERHEATRAALADRGARAERLAASTSRTSRILLIALLVIGAGAVAAVARRTTRATVGPLARLTDTLDRLRTDRGERAQVEGPVEVRAVATAINRLAEENQRFADERAQVVARLEDLDRQKSDFVSVVSHELRTPLTSIIGYLEMLEDGDAGPLSPEQIDLLAVGQRNAGRLLALIEDLLTLSRIESGKLRREEVPVDLAGVVADVTAELRPRLAGRDLDLTVTTDPAAPVLGDRDHLERVLFNLVGNALKFTPDGGEVTVSAHLHGDEVVVAVGDTGIGIPEDEIDHLFDRFYRASTATSRAIPGTGLGLAITGLLVEQHGGRIEVASRAGAGTTFTVRLPANSEEAFA